MFRLNSFLNVIRIMPRSVCTSIMGALFFFKKAGPSPISLEPFTVSRIVDPRYTVKDVSALAVFSAGKIKKCIILKMRYW